MENMLLQKDYCPDLKLCIFNHQCLLHVFHGCHMTAKAQIANYTANEAGLNLDREASNVVGIHFIQLSYRSIIDMTHKLIIPQKNTLKLAKHIVSQLYIQKSMFSR